MALPPVNANCAHCATNFTAQPKRSFLAFQKLTCPVCNKVTKYPLTAGYRNIYWGLAILTVLSFLAKFSQGEVKMGGLGVLAMLILFRDGTIRNRTDPTGKNHALLPGALALLLAVTFIATTYLPAYERYLSRATLKQGAAPAYAPSKQNDQKSYETKPSKVPEDINGVSSIVATLGRSQSWLSTYLSDNVPTAVIRSLRDREKPEYDFRLHPYVAVLTGTFTSERGEIPTQMSISFRKKCSWLSSVDLTVFMKKSGYLARMYSMSQTDESLDATKAYEQSYTEIAIAQTNNADAGNIINQSIENYFVTKTVDGYEIAFDAPEEKTLTSTESAMFTIESEQHMLEMLKKGVHNYTQKTIDADAEKLYSKYHITTVPYTNNPLGIRLWERTSEYFESIDGKWTVTGSMSEIVNTQGVAVYVALEVSEFNYEFALKEISFLPIERCTTEGTTI